MNVAIVFDLDDTLYLERDYVRSGFRHIARFLKCSEIHEDVLFDNLWSRFERGESGKLFDSLLNDFPILSERLSVPDLVSAYRKHYPEIGLLPGIASLLKQVQSRVWLGVITDGYLESQKMKINALSLSANFDEVILTDVWGRKYWKPHQRAFEHVESRTDLPSQRHVYIADNVGKDFFAPNRMGWHSIRFRHPEQLCYSLEAATHEGEPRDEVDSVMQLTAKLERWIAQEHPVISSTHRQRKVDRLYLSPPHLGSSELEYIREAFRTNWVAPLGPHVNAFEKEFADKVGSRNAVALSSGTAALHLALKLSGIGRDDEVLVSSFTFCASVNPILYEDAVPVFVDCDLESWNLNPELVEYYIRNRARTNRLPKALIVVHIYGQTADLARLVSVCDEFGITLIEDAAEALGATYKGQAAGSLGRAGIYSFNGNKIITTSGGGMLVTDDSDFAAHARKLATQARESVDHYEHVEIGFNYRMSNVLAGIGRGQLRKLDKRVDARRRNFSRYEALLQDLPGVDFMPEASWGRSTRWLTCLTIDPGVTGVDREVVRLALEAENIESRPVWKPMHLQPVFQEFEVIGGEVSQRLFERGLCLPSGSNLSDDDLNRVVNTVRRVLER